MCSFGRWTMGGSRPGLPTGAQLRARLVACAGRPAHGDSPGESDRGSGGWDGWTEGPPQSTEESV
jgi:hypothetical protein